jgi:hypothetical protein
MADIWEITYRADGRTERVELARPPVELIGLGSQSAFAVQLVPVKGAPYSLSTQDVSRIRKVEP